MDKMTCHDDDYISIYDHRSLGISPQNAEYGSGSLNIATVSEWSIYSLSNKQLEVLLLIMNKSESKVFLLVE